MDTAAWFFLIVVSLGLRAAWFLVTGEWCSMSLMNTDLLQWMTDSNAGGGYASVVDFIFGNSISTGVNTADLINTGLLGLDKVLRAILDLPIEVFLVFAGWWSIASNP